MGCVSCRSVRRADGRSQRRSSSVEPLVPAGSVLRTSSSSSLLSASSSSATGVRVVQLSLATRVACALCSRHPMWCRHRVPRRRSPCRGGGGVRRVAGVHALRCYRCVPTACPLLCPCAVRASAAPCSHPVAWVLVQCLLRMLPRIARHPGSRPLELCRASLCRRAGGRKARAEPRQPPPCH